MIFLCHPSLRAGAVNDRSRDPGLRRRWTLCSPLPLVVGSSLAPRPQVGPGSRSAEALRVTVVQTGECTSREAIGGGVCTGWSGPPWGWTGRPPGASERRSQKRKGKWIYSGASFPFWQLLEKVL